MLLSCNINSGHNLREEKMVEVVTRHNSSNLNKAVGFGRQCIPNCP